MTGTLWAPKIDMLEIQRACQYGAYWLWMAGDQEVDPTNAILQIQPWSDLRRTCPLIIKEVMDRIQSSKNPAENARLQLEGMYLIAGRTQFLHPELGRPTWAFKSAIRLVELFRHLVSGNHEWMNDEVGRDFTRARLHHFPAEIRSAMELWFHRDSVGWMNFSEFADALRVLDAIIDTEGTYDQIKSYWKIWKGDEADFAQMWETFLDEMRAVREEVKQIQPNKDVRVRYSTKYYQAELERRGCTDSMSDLAAAAMAEWDKLSSLAEQLAKKAGYRGLKDWAHNFRFQDGGNFPLLDSDADLLEAYTNGSRQVFDMIRDLGLLEGNFPDNYTCTVKLITDADGAITTTASCHPGRRSDHPKDPCHTTIKVGGWERFPEPARTRHQRHQSQFWPVIIWHEMVHVLQDFLRPGIVVHQWTWGAAANIAMEGSAFCAEVFLPQTDPDNIDLLLSVVQHRLQRLGRLIVENMYLEGASFEDVVEKYMELSGLDRHSATIECQRMTIDPLQFSSYVLGSWLLERCAQGFQDNLAECWSVYMRETAGFVQPNFWAAVRGDTESADTSWVPPNSWLAQYILENWLSKKD